MYTDEDIKTAWLDSHEADYTSFKAGFEAGHGYYLDQIAREREQLREQQSRSGKLQREARNSPHYRKMT